MNVAAASLSKFLLYSCLSRPSHERTLYRAIRRLKANRVVELGIEQAVRSARMIKVALRYCGDAPVHYTGIDMFEGRTGGEAGLTLKEAHRRLTTLGAQIRLVPGDTCSALSRCANSLRETDLLVISHSHAVESLTSAATYIPRLLCERSLVFVEQPPWDGRKAQFLLMEASEFEAAAAKARVDNRAAA
jgi:hypothetical protein